MTPIICPWCGTNYTDFQSNCKNCGGPIPLALAEEPLPEEVRLTLPPPPPRPIAENYARKLLAGDGWSTGMFVVVLVGVIFFVVGAILTIAIITAFVGIPFVLLGIGMAGGGGAILYWRYGEAKKTVEVLRLGEAVQGQIVDVTENLNVEVNGRHPCTISYAFQVDGTDYQGKVTTLNRLAPNIQPAQPAIVLYLPSAPLYNTLYPHP